jgi:hypothetical protein
MLTNATESILMLTAITFPIIALSAQKRLAILRKGFRIVCVRFLNGMLYVFFTVKNRTIFPKLLYIVCEQLLHGAEQFLHSILLPIIIIPSVI